MKWRGIRRDSIDIGPAEEGLLAINTRFTTEGELRRRRGLARSSIERKNASVTTINGFSPFQSNVLATLTDGDRIQGYSQPFSKWPDTPNYSVDTSGTAVFDMTYTSGQLVNSILSGQLAGNITPTDATGITSSAVHTLVLDTAKEAFSFTNKTLSYTSATAILEVNIAAMQAGYQITFGTTQCKASVQRKIDGTYRVDGIGRTTTIEYVAPAMSSGTHTIQTTVADGTMTLYLDGTVVGTAAQDIIAVGTETYGIHTSKFSAFAGTSAIIRYVRMDLA
jgi:hypothetical protein